MSVRAKMRLNAIITTSFNVGSPEVKELQFVSCYDTSIPEDQRFQKATPNASAKFQIDNEDALKQFEPGKSYYLDFTPADPVQ